MHFANLIRPHRIPPVPERFCVKGIRTHNRTKEKTAVRCVFEVRFVDSHDGNSGWVLKIVEGGVTGFESFYLTGPLATRNVLNEMAKRGWAANFGGMGYDALDIDADNMEALARWVREQLDNPKQWIALK